MEVLGTTGLVAYPPGEIQLVAVLVLDPHVQVGRGLYQVSEVLLVVDYLEATVPVGGRVAQPVVPKQAPVEYRHTDPRQWASLPVDDPSAHHPRTRPFLRPVRVLTGLTDGVNTEIVQVADNDKLSEGDEVVTGENQASNAGGDGVKNPFAPPPIFKRR